MGVSNSPSASKRKQLPTHAVLANGTPAFWHGQGFDSGTIAHFVRVAGGADGSVFAFGAVVINVRFDGLLACFVGTGQVVHHPHAAVVAHFGDGA